jgi:hypothetical protein
VTKWYEHQKWLTNQASDGGNHKIFFDDYTEVFEAMFPPGFSRSIFDSKGPLQDLDVCMAIGGFARTILSKNKDTFVTGVSLPPEDGGHSMYKDDKEGIQKFQDRFHIEYRDITTDQFVSYPPFPSREQRERPEQSMTL